MQAGVHVSRKTEYWREFAETRKSEMMKVEIIEESLCSLPSYYATQAPFCAPGEKARRKPNFQYAMTAPEANAFLLL